MLSNLLTNIKIEFDGRHDFEDDDLNILFERWPNIKFENIPVSWIVPVDEMLCHMRLNNPVKEVRQHFGQLIVITDVLTDKQKKIVKATENKIYSIDKDLYARRTI